MAASIIPAFDPAKSLVRVGDGRGFVVEETAGFRRRFVITASHCLPNCPAPPGFREAWAETFQDLLGPIGGSPTVWAECLFADPIADVAVLGSPDTQSLSGQADAYAALVDAAHPLKIGDVPDLDTPTPARLIALDGRLIDCTVQHYGDPFSVENATNGIVGGMSGSPVLNLRGAAIGIASQSSGTLEEIPTAGSAPRLVISLPGWLLLNLGAIGLLAAARRALRIHDRHIAERFAAIK